MGNLATVQTKEHVSTVLGTSQVPNTLATKEALDLPFTNYRQFTVPNVATVFTPDFMSGGLGLASQQIIVGTAAGFTIANPINLPAGSALAGFVLVLTIVNSSGGALGAITAGSAYKLQGAAFPVVADGTRQIMIFVNLGTEAAPVYYEIIRPAAGTPN